MPARALPAKARERALGRYTGLGALARAASCTLLIPRRGSRTREMAAGKRAQTSGTSRRAQRTLPPEVAAGDKENVRQAAATPEPAPDGSLERSLGVLTSSGLPPERELVDVLQRVVVPALRSLRQLALEASPPSTLPSWLEQTAQALVRPQLLTHSSNVVQLSVACALAEVLRVLAPTTPYDADTMQHIFELFVRALYSLEGPCQRHAPDAVDTSQWSSGLLECLARIKAFVVAPAEQLASLIQCVVSVASTTELSFKAKTHMTELVASALAARTAERSAKPDADAGVFDALLPPLLLARHPVVLADGTPVVTAAAVDDDDDIGSGTLIGATGRVAATADSNATGTTYGNGTAPAVRPARRHRRVFEPARHRAEARSDRRPVRIGAIHAAVRAAQSVGRVARRRQRPAPALRGAAGASVRHRRRKRLHRPSAAAVARALSRLSGTLQRCRATRSCVRRAERRRHSVSVGGGRRCRAAVGSARCRFQGNRTRRSCRRHVARFAAAPLRPPVGHRRARARDRGAGRVAPAARRRAVRGHCVATARRRPGGAQPHARQESERAPSGRERHPSALSPPARRWGARIAPGRRGACGAVHTRAALVLLAADIPGGRRCRQRCRTDGDGAADRERLVRRQCRHTTGRSVVAGGRASSDLRQGDQVVRVARRQRAVQYGSVAGDGASAGALPRDDAAAVGGARGGTRRQDARHRQRTERLEPLVRALAESLGERAPAGGRFRAGGMAAGSASAP
eukprot:ctg_1642.g405